ncbi:MAG: hypothetical protein KDH96_07205 [Candidatus Riesia sp.]|nr:hypothetical protein [Candidatus Riesia sp.]
MSNLEKFKSDLEDKYGSGYLWEFIDDTEMSALDDLPLGAVLVEDKDDVTYDSYGNEDSTLKRIFKLPDYGDIHVMFEGTRRSYAGEEWDSVKEVQQKEKVIKYWE